MKRPIYKYLLFILLGLFLGWMFFSGESEPKKTESYISAPKEQIWTCSMHPQIREDHPGHCPICGMELIPLVENHEHKKASPHAISFSPEMAAVAQVETIVVREGAKAPKLELYGVIDQDQRRSYTVSAHIGGRIEKLYVNFTGDYLRSGETVATIYSPELYAAQRELLEAVKLKQPLLIKAAKEKLALWKITPQQIDEIIAAGVPNPYFPIVTEEEGFVTEKLVEQGDYVAIGEPLYKVSNLKKVWGVFDAYEQDLPFIKLGDTLSFTVTAIPGKEFKGKISFIDPLINPTTRTAAVRIDIDNIDHQLKPQMYAIAEVRTQWKSGRSDLMLPKSAILWTGTRSVVFVQQPEIIPPAYELRMVTLGPEVGDYYVIKEGIRVGDIVVVNGNFVIDAAAQLAGKPNMMDTLGGAPLNTMPGMDMGHSGTMKMDGDKKMPEMKQSHEMHSNHSTHSISSTKMSGEMQMKTDTLWVNGKCESCKKRIEKAALSVEGVMEAHWDITDKILTVSFNPKKTNLEMISKHIASVGHDTVLNKASNKIYDGLPACCHYRK